MIQAGTGVFTELKNLCVWVKSNGGMGSFYRSRHELVFVWKSGRKPHVNNFELGQFGRSRTNVWKYDGGKPTLGRSGVSLQQKLRAPSLPPFNRI
jgi:hypothetical protein